MPKLTDLRQTKEIALPSFPDSKLVVYDRLLFGDLIAAQKIDDDAERGVEISVRLIKDWNFTDDAGAKLPINSENIKKLPIEDMSILLIEVNAALAQLQEKKTSK